MTLRLATLRRALSPARSTSARPSATRASARPAALALAGALLVGGLVAGCSSDDGATGGSSPAATVTATPTSAGTFTRDADSVVTGLSYPGQDGKTALELLLAADPSAQVTGSGANAFVTGIGGRVADDSKREFWALSVGGKEAQVGAGSLDTKDGETITWTLTTY